MRNSVLQIFALVIGHAIGQIAVSAGYADERAALSAIYADDHIQGEALSIHEKAMQLPLEQRFSFLSKWVLPNEDHPTLRLQIAFLNTDHGAPNAIEKEHRGTVSPFFDLITTAVELNRLEDVQRKVLDWNVDSQRHGEATNEAELDRQIALTLIEIVDQKYPQAETQMESVLQILLQGSLSQAPKTAESNTQNSNKPATAAGSQGVDQLLAPSDGVILLAAHAAEIRQLREQSARLLSRYDKWARNNYEPDARRRHVMGLINRMAAVEASLAADTNLGDAGRVMSQWRPVSRMTAVSRGTGNPHPQWLFSSGQVELVSPHDRDYLYFNTPLKDNYDLECDVSMESWSIASPMVAGYWLGPIYTQNGFDTGCVRWQGPRINFAPILTKGKRWMRYRTTVRDGVATTCFNGRPIQTRPAKTHHDPWIAIRSNPRDHGKVRDFRISGSPVIPGQIELLNDSGLGVWQPYFGETVGDVGDHWVMKDGVLYGQNGSALSLTEIDSLRPSDDASSNAGWDERVLQYHRPMFEDGVIAYDFFYSPEKICVHPALDRTVWLIGDDGVQLHEITDGAFDRTERSPAHILDVPESGRGPESIPLRPDDWNRMELHLTGDVVSLVLNGVQIFERALESGNRRTFGLFHFADKTSVQARNMVWNGNWPTELPSIADQELAIPEAETLDEGADRLAATYHHDFGKDGLPRDRFKVMSGSLGTHLKVAPEGLTVEREGTGGYLNATVAPTMVISGDFDAVAEYDRFDASSDVTGSGTIALIAMLDNNSQDEFCVFRRHMPRANSVVEQVLQCALVRRLPEGERRNYFVTEPMEETSGRLRLSRRGDTMYYLTAEHDSSNFRIRGKQSVTSDSLKLDGLRLLTQIHQEGGTVRVVWKSLTIRAEDIDSIVINPEERVETLNLQREQLADHLACDFRQQAPAAEQFYRWNSPDSWNENDKGWLIRSIGADTWTSAGVSPYTQLSGDFDITIQFRPEQLAPPKEGQHTQIYLQVEAPDAQRTQINSVYTLPSSGETIAEARIRTRKDKDSYNYLGLGQIGMKACCRLRIARRGTKVTFLAAANEDAMDEVIADYEFVDLPILQAGIRVMVHTGGGERESKVILESLAIHAASINQSARPEVLPMTNSPDPATPASESLPAKSLLERILDNFGVR